MMVQIILISTRSEQKNIHIFAYVTEEAPEKSSAFFVPIFQRGEENHAVSVEMYSIIRKVRKKIQDIGKEKR